MAKKRTNVSVVQLDMDEASNILFKPVLSDIRDYSVVDQVFDEFKPQVAPLHAGPLANMFQCKNIFHGSSKDKCIWHLKCFRHFS